jgi:hypothetical protein
LKQHSRRRAALGLADKSWREALSREGRQQRVEKSELARSAGRKPLGRSNPPNGIGIDALPADDCDGAFGERASRGSSRFGAAGDRGKKPDEQGDAGSRKTVT